MALDLSNYVIEQLPVKLLICVNIAIYDLKLSFEKINLVLAQLIESSKSASNEELDIEICLIYRGRVIYSFDGFPKICEYEKLSCEESLSMMEDLIQERIKYLRTEICSDKGIQGHCDQEFYRPLCILFEDMITDENLLRENVKSNNFFNKAYLFVINCKSTNNSYKDFSARLKRYDNVLPYFFSIDTYLKVLCNCLKYGVGDFYSQLAKFVDDQFDDKFPNESVNLNFTLPLPDGWDEI